ncbi:Complement C3 [Lamellibrachia satsuma]|nr:Complement C3 [Lamellibrachia satsuma]
MDPKSKHWDYKMGIDISRAFNTIKRSRLRVGVNTVQFVTSISSPRGYGLAGVLFVTSSSSSPRGYGLAGVLFVTSISSSPRGYGLAGVLFVTSISSSPRGYGLAGVLFVTSISSSPRGYGLAGVLFVTSISSSPRGYGLAGVLFVTSSSSSPRGYGLAGVLFVTSSSSSPRGYGLAGVLFVTSSSSSPRGYGLAGVLFVTSISSSPRGYGLAGVLFVICSSPRGYGLAGVLFVTSISSSRVVTVLLTCTCNHIYRSNAGYEYARSPPNVAERGGRKWEVGPKIGRRNRTEQNQRYLARSKHRRLVRRPVLTENAPATLVFIEDTRNKKRRLFSVVLDLIPVFRSLTHTPVTDGAMAPGMAVVIPWLITASFLPRISFPLSQSSFTLFIVAPDVFYMDHEETVSVTVFNAPTATVELYLTNEPVDTSIFSRVNVRTQLGQPTLAKVRVTSADLLWGTASEEYVNLVAKCTVGGQTVQKKTLVRVSMWTHSVFLQTDKPIYTPRQTVCTRIFTMDRHLRPADVPVRLDFLNPDGIIVERSSDLHSADGFLEKNFTFPSSFGVQGKWSLVAAYGVQNSQNVTAKFLVKEYVLPTFALTIGPPKYIYRGATVTGNVTARHVYGKPVKGTVYMKFGVIKKDSPCLIFAKKANLRLNNGGVTFTLNPGTHLRGLGNEFAFPALEGAHLHIEATVTETATGKKESRIDRAAVFAIKKHKVSFQRSSKHFKPGLPYVVKVTLTSASGLPSTYLPLTINAVATRSSSGQVTLSAHENQAITDDQGRTMFTLDIPSDAVTLVVKAWPTGHRADVDLNTQLNLKPYNSPTRSYLLARPRLDEYKVGNIMEVEVLATALSDIKQLNYMVGLPGVKCKALFSSPKDWK